MQDEYFQIWFEINGVSLSVEVHSVGLAQGIWDRLNDHFKMISARP